MRGKPLSRIEMELVDGEKSSKKRRKMVCLKGGAGIKKAR